MALSQFNALLSFPSVFIPLKTIFYPISASSSPLAIDAKASLLQRFLSDLSLLPTHARNAMLYRSGLIFVFEVVTPSLKEDLAKVLSCHGGLDTCLP